MVFGLMDCLRKKIRLKLRFISWILFPDNFLRNIFGYWGYVSEVQRQDLLIAKNQSESEIAIISAQQAENRARQAEINAKRLEEKINTLTMSKFKSLKSLLHRIIFAELPTRVKFFSKRILYSMIQTVLQRQRIKKILLYFLNYFPETKHRLKKISFVIATSPIPDQNKETNDSQLSARAHHILCSLKTMMSNHNKKDY